MWMIIGGGAALVGFLVWNSRRPKKFSYRGKSYARHADGSYIATSELDEVRDHWDSSHDSSSSDSSDGGSDGGGGDGGGGGGD
jgi:hypothetical protein